jgi:hypothetical protein
MTTWVRVLIAFVVFCHGFIYIRIGSVLPGPIQEWSGSSWFLGSAVTSGQLRALAIGLHVIAGIATIACAFAIGFAPSVPHWWRRFAITGAAVGIAAFSVFWDGQIRLLFDEGVIGAIVSVILLATAIVFPAAFR